MKQFFKHGVIFSALLLSLLACETIEKTTFPISSETDTRIIQQLDLTKEYQEGKQNENEKEATLGHTIIKQKPHQVMLNHEEAYQLSLGLGSTSIPIYRYNQDKGDDTPVTIISSPGLTDANGPTTLIEPLLGNYNIGKSYTMITRASENEDIDTHVENAYRILREEDRLRDRLLMIPESFGTYIAYGLSLKYPDLNIVGMISIHGPWEGVSGAAHIIRAYRKLQKWHLSWMVDSVLDYHQLSSYKIPKALETLDPNGFFLQKVRNTLPNVSCPILALAGKSTERTGPYAYLYKLCKESNYNNRINSLGASMVLGPVDRIIQEYDLGNDGLVTTASALAQNIPNKPASFRGVIADATHFHYELNRYPKLWSEVTDFVKALDRKQVEK